MTKLDERPASAFVKLILLGNSGSGKTGALSSLVPNYNLRIIDTDNGLDSLVNQVQLECPNRLSSIDYESCRDKIVPGPTGPTVRGVPTGYMKALKLLDKWSDGTVPSNWGPEYILVIDSLTSLSGCAFNYARAQNPSSKEPRQWYFAAQSYISDLLLMLTDPEFKAHVIIMGHIDSDENKDGEVTSQFIASVGKALGPKIPRSFNTMLMMDKIGMGTGVRRSIRTLPTAMLDLKNPAPTKIEASLDIKDGLAKIFKQLTA